MSVDEQQQQSATRRWWQFWRRPTTTTPAAGADHVPRFPAVYAVEIAAVAGGLIATIIYAVAGPGTSRPTPGVRPRDLRQICLSGIRGGI